VLAVFDHHPLHPGRTVFTHPRLGAGQLAGDISANEPFSCAQQTGG